MLPVRIKLIYVVVFIMCCCFLFVSYIGAKVNKSKDNITLTIARVENRIALDLNHLNLPDDFLQHSGSKEMIINYITRLNAELSHSGVTVYSIEGVSELPAQNGLISKQLDTPQRTFQVSFLIEPHVFDKNDIAVLVLVFFFSSALTYLLFVSERRKIRVAKHKPDVSVKVEEKPKLIVDLQNKTFVASCALDKKICLANKPLCFYLALVEFCIEYPDVVLNQNKNVPEELLTLANKYFYRLVELGHTIRKRPNFTNSLEKTLSEIRAALDDVWQEQPEIKETYYPPKAHGEGSRSRLHHYGLKAITCDDIEVIGK